MFAQERHQAILTALEKQPSITLTALEGLLKASPATIRRDLTFLEKLGKLVRTHGGVLHPDHAQGEVSFDRKSRESLEAKLALAKSAAALVKPGATVFVDAGTTTLEIGRLLVARPQLTLFTNSVPLLSERPAADTRLIAIGGEVRSVSLALTGAGALEWVRRLRPDFAFLGASGIDASGGPCTTELSEAGVKGAIAAGARRAVVVVDSSKWDQPAAIRYANWAQIHDVFTDRAFTRAERTALTSHGTTLHVVTR
ncbi:MAG: DeoR family transcriptional regulator [Rariglobus sp.]|nr:DeoR family transcriptional regulator [Rariglobus sp.]